MVYALPPFLEKEKKLRRSEKAGVKGRGREETKRPSQSSYYFSFPSRKKRR